MLYLSPTYEGSVHDKKICDEEALEFPKELRMLQDCGFQGYNPEGVSIVIPKKSSKHHKLTEQDKLSNKEKASERVVVEHAISGIKRCRILKDKFRNRRYGLEDTVMFICCGLHNYRLKKRIQIH